MMTIMELSANAIYTNRESVVKELHHVYFVEGYNSTEVKKSKVYGYKSFVSPSGRFYHVKVWSTKENKMVFVRCFAKAD